LPRHACDYRNDLPHSVSVPCDCQPVHTGAPLRLRGGRLVLALRRCGVAVPVLLHLRLGRQRYHSSLMDAAATAQGTVKAALLGRCPRCGQGSLFNGYLNVASRCAHCALDYATFDPGDGPAMFVILIVGFLVAGGALIVEVKFQPPYWVHAVIW